MPEFYEFFAGGGMARAGLGKRWTCLFANDFDYKKARVYEKNWGQGEMKAADVGSLATSDRASKMLAVIEAARNDFKETATVEERRQLRKELADAIARYDGETP